jgi:hypothetical protein
VPAALRQNPIKIQSSRGGEICVVENKFESPNYSKNWPVEPTIRSTKAVQILTILHQAMRI